LVLVFFSLFLLLVFSLRPLHRPILIGNGAPQDFVSIFFLIPFMYVSFNVCSLRDPIHLPFFSPIFRRTRVLGKRCCSVSRSVEEILFSGFLSLGSTVWPRSSSTSGLLRSRKAFDLWYPLFVFFFLTSPNTSPSAASGCPPPGSLPRPVTLDPVLVSHPGDITLPLLTLPYFRSPPPLHFLFLLRRLSPESAAPPRSHYLSLLFFSRCPSAKGLLLAPTSTLEPVFPLVFSFWFRNGDVRCIPLLSSFFWTSCDPPIFFFRPPSL